MLILAPPICHAPRPMTSAELMKTIRDVSGDDHSAVALTQEILVYLSMFFRSEPNLFQDMLRLRIGLIQNVMVTELGRAMAIECSGKEWLHYVRLHVWGGEGRRDGWKAF